MTQAPVNSRQWWDWYFREHWDKNQGRSQTTYFMQQLLMWLPERERQFIAKPGRTILDWGCALGDGVAALGAAFPESRVTGLDFSEQAILTARSRWPGKEFIQTSDGAIPASFDVIVTSNCLEHFAQPLATAAQHLRHVKSLYLVLVPYEEKPPLHDQHVARFARDTFPKQLDGFSLIFCREIPIDPPYWHGSQLLVIYASPEYMRQCAVRPGTPAPEDALRSRDAALLDRHDAQAAQAYAAYAAAHADLQRAAAVERARLAAAELTSARSQVRQLQSQLHAARQTLEYLNHRFAESADRQSALYNDFQHGLRGELQREISGLHEALQHIHKEHTRRADHAAQATVDVANRVTELRRQAENARETAHGIFLGMQELRESAAETRAGMRELLRHAPEARATARGTLAAVEQTINQPGIFARWRHALIGNARRLFGAAPRRQGAPAGVAASSADPPASASVNIDPSPKLAPPMEDLTVAAAAEPEYDARTGTSHHAAPPEPQAAAAGSDPEETASSASGASPSFAENESLAVAEVPPAAPETAVDTPPETPLSETLLEASPPTEEPVEAAAESWPIPNQKVDSPISENSASVETSGGEIAAPNMGVAATELPEADADADAENIANWEAPVVGVAEAFTAEAMRSEFSDNAHAQWPAGPRPFDVLMFPVIDWDFRHQRSQHLALQLAGRGHRIFYFSTTLFSESAGATPQDRTVAPNVEICCLETSGTAPVIYRQPLTQSQVEATVANLEKFCRRRGIATPLCIVSHPFWGPVVRRLENQTTIYDCMDYHAGFADNSPEIISLEDELLKQADLTLVTSARLHDQVSPRTGRCVLIRNAGEFDFFHKQPGRLAFSGGRPVIGYFGAIAEWFDIDLVAHCAKTLPECDFVLIGSTAGADVSAFRDLPNVRLTGEVAYENLPAYLHAFDVCLIPFKTNELTLCTNPVKVYEYLAAGKPVVATDLPEVRLMADVVHVADNSDAFVAGIRKALAESGAPVQQCETAVQRRIAFARENTWRARGAQLYQEINGLFPKVSIVTLTHNALDATRRCLDHLEHCSAFPNWELVLVDNASTDGTPDFLREFAAGRHYVTLRLNGVNEGFPAGNNHGARLTLGDDYLLFLNNDVCITRGFITTMLRHFRRDSRIGILGPVTNSISNEARVDLPYGSLAEMAIAARPYTTEHSGEVFDIRTASFFCVMVARRVWAEVGQLDTGFGLGMLEDDDYAMRVREKGYRVACARDAFVHHENGASFGQLDRDFRLRLLEANRAYFESKWGAWQPPGGAI